MAKREIKRRDLKVGMRVEPPRTIFDSELGKRVPFKTIWQGFAEGAPLPRELVVKVWNDDGETHLQDPASGLGVDYNQLDYPETFVVVGGRVAETASRMRAEVQRGAGQPRLAHKVAREPHRGIKFGRVV